MTTIEILLAHRSIRKFTEECVSPEVLQQILRAACNGSTMGNMQLFSIIVTQDKAKMNAMAPAHFHQPMATNAPLMLTFCADFHRFDRYCECRQVPTDAYHNSQAYQWALTDALIAAQNACVAAESLGLGFCWLGTITYNVPQFIEAFQLPYHVMPAACVVFGYPDQQPPLTDKLPIEALIHQEVYCDYSDQQINQYYVPLEKKEHNVQVLKENHFDNLAQDYVFRRYKKEDNEFFSQILSDNIRKQGFEK